MIKLTRLNGKPFFINAIFIETIESFPDTTITLTNNNKYVVREKEEQVTQMVEKFYRSINLLGRQLEDNEDEE
ncbi:flagellar FlbD family protein [Bacillus massilinigeriensis]|uniref:flagellar FlbD family protein n=1 Tax=Bacillus massilionigeriensis TaxID=1805475 RepID=UPI00096AFCF7|nr:flagellar FlbD family protein [Bacillus massilionigeriensis]